MSSLADSSAQAIAMNHADAPSIGFMHEDALPAASSLDSEELPSTTSQAPASGPAVVEPTQATRGPRTRSKRKATAPPPDGAPRKSTRARKRTIKADEKTPSAKAAKTLAKVSAKAPPKALEIKDEELENCCICMGDVEKDDLAGINGCDHKFCFGCIEQWSERENTCPLCKVRFTKIDRLHRQKRGTNAKNTKKVRQRDQSSVTAFPMEHFLDGFLANITGSFPNRSRPQPNRPRVQSFEFHLATGLNEDFIQRAQIHFLEPHSATGFMVHPSELRPPSIYGLSRPSRSYATNSDDHQAGSRVENPLEINDSDDEDDGIEIVRVVNGNR
eukprot:Nitzschia sp. Nitz4//scaffold54_size114964//35755//36830//NITZ4_003843-RA/size114964-augustus-gene-0.17-mRNA-1//-1//CDS//3329554327//4109//frame0